MDEIAPGKRVRTKDLTGRPELNNRVGEVLYFVPVEGQDGRWQTRLDGGDRSQPPGVFAIPVAKLEVLTEDEAWDEAQAKMTKEALSKAERQKFASLAATITQEANAAAAGEEPDAAALPKFPLVRCEVRALPGRGFGVVATTALARGDCVLADQPLFRVTEREIAAAKTQGAMGDLPAVEMMVRSKLTLLPAEQRSGFWSLCDCFGTEEKKKSAYGIVETNAIASAQEGSEASRGVYVLGSRFNHSCKHNVSRVWIESQGVEVFHATRAVADGEELFIQYTDPKSGFAERQSTLKDKFLFDCDCKTCRLDEAARKVSDGLREEYRKLDEGIPRMSSKPKAALKFVERVLEIITLEFGGEPYLEQATCYFGFQMALYAGDLDLGRSWMQRACEAKLSAEGQHPGVAQWRAWAADPSQHRIAKEMRLVAKKVKPNEPCPCNSGKKYKKCCGVAV